MDVSYKYLELIIKSYNEASDHPELTADQKDKIRQVLQKRARNYFGTPDQSEEERIANFGHLFVTGILVSFALDH